MSGQAVGPLVAARAYSMDGMHHATVSVAGVKGSVLAIVSTHTVSDRQGVPSDPDGSLCSALAAQFAQAPTLLADSARLRAERDVYRVALEAAEHSFALLPGSDAFEAKLAARAALKGGAE